MSAPVVDVRVSDDGERVLASYERGDVSVAIEAPADVDQDALEAALADAPDSLSEYTSRRVSTGGGADA